MDNFSLQNKSIICIAKRNSGKSELIKYLVKNSIINNFKIFINIIFIKKKKIKIF